MNPARMRSYNITLKNFKIVVDTVYNLFYNSLTKQRCFKQFLLDGRHSVQLEG